jgi:hypothetical protein
VLPVSFGDRRHIDGLAYKRADTHLHVADPRVSGGADGDEMVHGDVLPSGLPAEFLCCSVAASGL